MDIRQYFAQFSLGNIGSSGAVCAEVNLAKNKQKVQLGCPSGSFSHLISVGLSNNELETCPSEVSDKGFTLYYGFNGDLEV